MAEINKIIKNARDVLVGKVPDPQSQIDQITLALIYKFMDAKDREARGYDLPATFFVGEYDDYSFTKIMQATNNSEKFNLYSKGIELLQNRTDLPSTFVSVFKDAFIPYRDPQTLNLFLAEIDKIPTDNTELLGTAFEDLLSIMGSQGDAGQFRTPRHIIDMIVEIVNPQKCETILDPACGTAGFLISAYNKIIKEDLSIEEREHLMTDGLVGYDINPNMVKLANVNLFLHNCKKPNIHLYDTLSEKTYWKDNYDVILANPPFMTPRGGIRPHQLFNAINANRSEVLFTYYIAKHLKRDGRAGVIVPEGVVFQSANAYKNLRRMLIEENYLYAVISLPSGVFNPYSGVKTSILLMDRALARKTDKILFVKIKNDGFELGAQRRQIEENDIPNVINLMRQYISYVKTESKEIFVDDFGLSVLASKEEIAENDYVLVGDRYKQNFATTGRVDFELLGNVCQIISGQSPEGKFYNIQEEGMPFYQGKTEFTDKYLGKPLKWTKQITKVAPKGSIVMSVRAPVGPVNIVNDCNVCIGRGLAAIVCTEKINSEFLFYYLRSIEKQITGTTGAAFASISRAEIQKIKIPLPPLEIQKQIVAEIDGYQKIIDGAKQVIENYRPKLKVNSSWVVKSLADIASLSYGYTATAQERGDIRYIRITDIDENGELRSNDAKFIDLNVESQQYFLQKGDIVVARTGATYGKTLYYKENEPAVYASFLIKINLPSYIDTRFYWVYAQTEEYWQQAKSLVSGGGQPQFNANAIKQIHIPIPSIEEQKEIVLQIEKELEYISNCKNLIKIFERKIKDKLSEVWGE